MTFNTCSTKPSAIQPANFAVDFTLQSGTKFAMTEDIYKFYICTHELKDF